MTWMGGACSPSWCTRGATATARPCRLGVVTSARTHAPATAATSAPSGRQRAALVFDELSRQRPVMLRYLTADSCIAATRSGLDVCSYFAQVQQGLREHGGLLEGST